ncbi:MAG: hypothetical protein CSH36_01555 [Thalassolituus sp.]|uniref:hypothetical protein n=1 Tax=uncultured Thalassolituus sp. TaxID=285273 RepID=UPI00263A2110|nr:hypothetical protein [uncultured Thalassolituus sp.]TNC93017.1 MAG: hypothetical protein CSH36_01555 [Thalassolituus sp.]
MMASEQTPLRVAAKYLSLSGTSTYHIEDETLHVEVEEIANLRSTGNTSGTLSLEMWALSEPYSGGDFRGYQVGATEIGELSGQHHLNNCRFTMPIRTPAEGQWYLVLMLREWENGAYVTRDHISFPQPIKAQYKLVLSLDGLPAVYRP